MTQMDQLPADETGFDCVFSFTVPGRDSRGRVVRLGPVLDAILAPHDYPPVVKNLLAEAVVTTALMGSLLKDRQGQVTIQAEATDGPVQLLVCDYRDGELRGYAKFDRDRMAGLGANPSLEALFGEGYLAVTFDLAATDKRYQGVVPLEGQSLAAACEAYFERSEQVPTLLRGATRSGADGCLAGGLLVQYLPDGEEGRSRIGARPDHPHWDHVAVMADSLRHEELLDPGLSMEALVWRLFHEEDEVLFSVGGELSRGCRCTEAHYRDILMRFPEEERAEMRDESGRIVVDCAFCSRLFPIDA